MLKAMIDVAAFHKACDLPILPSPQWPDEARIELRMALENEEHKELLAAVSQRDLAGVADALVDKIYIAIGTALEFGFSIDELWLEVQRANMSKVDSETGKVIKREDGKVLKPEGWTPPDIVGVLSRENKLLRNLANATKIEPVGDDTDWHSIPIA